MNRALLIITCVIAFAVGVGIAYYYANAQQAQNVLVPQTVAYRELVAQTSISGTTEAAESVDLAFKNGGIVDTVPVAVGDTVATGTTLAILQSTTLKDQIAQAEAALETQQANLTNLKNGTRPQQIAITRAQIASGESALTSANQGLASALSAAQSASDVAVRFTIDQFITNPTMVNSTLVVPVSDSTLGTTVLNERRHISDALASWSGRIDALQNATTSDLVAASVDMHAYLQTVSALLEGLTRILAADGVQYAASQTAVAAARTSVTSSADALTTADQAVTSARAAIDVAEKQLALEQAGSTSAAIAAQKAAVDSARAQVAELKNELKDQQITAPWSGIVSAVEAKAGETIAAGAPAVSLISDGPLKIEGYVPEIHYADIAVGQPVTITLDAFPGVTFSGELGRINPTATLQDNVPNFKVTVYFTSPDSRLRPGLTAHAEIQTADKPHALSIPIAAVTGTGTSASVMKLVGGTPTRTHVTLGIQSVDGYVEVTSGLSEGDTILVDDTKQYRIVPN